MRFSGLSPIRLGVVQPWFLEPVRNAGTAGLLQMRRSRRRLLPARPAAARSGSGSTDRTPAEALAGAHRRADRRPAGSVARPGRLAAAQGLEEGSGWESGIGAPRAEACRASAAGSP